MKKPEGSSGSRGLCAVYLIGLDSQGVDLEWGVVLVIVSQSVHKDINRFLVQAQININNS